MDLENKYISELENVTFQPIFIVGIARSGTSILYNTLAKSKCFNYVTVYHIMKYDQLLYNHINNLEEATKIEINDSFKKMGILSRGTDDLKISADSAEEYGFILANKTPKIFITPKNLSLFIELAKKIQYISLNNKPLLLKNPNEISNILYIKQAIPNAKFIFIHRHPYNIINSGLRIQRYLLNKTPKYYVQIDNFYKKNGYRVFTHAFRHFYSELTILGLIYTTLYSANNGKHLLKKFKHLSKENYIFISYEKLCQNPNETIKNIMEFLNIKTEKEIDYRQFIKPRDFPLDPYLIRMKKFIYKSMKSYFDYFGYLP